MAFSRALLITAGFLVLPAPATLAQSRPTTTNPGRVCTEIGCESGVFFNADLYLTAHPAVRRVRICALHRCRSTSRGDPTQRGQPLILPVAREQTISVTVTAFATHGVIVLRRTLVAHLRKTQPNGPHCQPVCFQATIRLPGTGRRRR